MSETHLTDTEALVLLHLIHAGNVRNIDPPDLAKTLGIEEELLEEVNCLFALAKVRVQEKVNRLDPKVQMALGNYIRALDLAALRSPEEETTQPDTEKISSP